MKFSLAIICVLAFVAVAAAFSPSLPLSRVQPKAVTPALRSPQTLKMSANDVSSPPFVLVELQLSSEATHSEIRLLCELLEPSAPQPLGPSAPRPLILQAPQLLGTNSPPLPVC